MRLDADPTRNPDFVMAMKYLFDREQMRSAVSPRLCGDRQRSADRSRATASTVLTCRSAPFDLDKAKFHFLKSGIGNTPVPIVASPAASSSVEMAVLLQRRGAEDRPQPRYQARAGRRLLVELLDEGAAGLRQHQSASQRRHPAHVVLQVRRAMERERAGRTRSSTSCCWRRAPRPMSPSASRCMATCRAWCAIECGIGIPLFISILDAHAASVKGLRADPDRRADGLQLRGQPVAGCLTRVPVAEIRDMLSAASRTRIAISLLTCWLVSVLVFARDRIAAGRRGGGGAGPGGDAGGGGGAARRDASRSAGMAPIFHLAWRPCCAAIPAARWSTICRSRN